MICPRCNEVGAVTVKYKLPSFVFKCEKCLSKASVISNKLDYFVIFCENYNIHFDLHKNETLIVNKISSNILFRIELILPFDISTDKIDKLMALV